MSGDGRPALEIPKADGLRVGVVATSWHAEITDVLLQRALWAALGTVIRGGTPHFDYVCDSVTAGLTRVALDAGVPVGNGVLTCDSIEQARARSGVEGAAEDKGAETMAAALSTALVLRRLRVPGGRMGFGR